MAKNIDLCFKNVILRTENKEQSNLAERAFNICCNFLPQLICLSFQVLHYLFRNLLICISS